MAVFEENAKEFNVSMGESIIIDSPGGGGADGVGIASVKQTTTSTQDGGANIITVTLTDGTVSTFTVRNGSKGSTGAAGANGKDGADGYTPRKGVDYWTTGDKAEMVNAVIDALPVYSGEVEDV